MTQKKMQQNEWLWDKHVCPDLLRDPRLRLEQRSVQGEVMECVTVLSPMAVRSFTRSLPGYPHSTPPSSSYTPAAAVFNTPLHGPPTTPDQQRSVISDAVPAATRGSSSPWSWLGGWWARPSSSPVVVDPPRWR